MNLREIINKNLNDEIKEFPKARKILDFLRTDKEIELALMISNDVTVNRLGYNDHGDVHAKIVSFLSAKLLRILYAKRVIPNLLKECKKATFEDALEIVIVAGYLHDIGNSILRDQHELTGFFIVKGILERIYPKMEEISELNERKKKLILEAVLCHMGSYQSTSLEAKVVPVADGCDMEAGRARIPYEKGKRDMHGLSALAITKVRVKEGKTKPISIYVEMESSAGIFQIEANLLKKIKDAGMEKYLEIEAFITSRKETINYLVENS